ncbi:MAG: DNA glycosylase AlkZ-like family protein [Gaiellaceae bacterium]
MAARITLGQALAWRMQRHLLDPIGRRSVPEVVGRLCGVQAQVASSAELAIRVRRERSRRGEVDRALREGRLIKTWAMRGTLHLLTPEEAGAFLSLMAAGGSWERPSWQRYFGVSPKQIQALRRAARAALESGPLTREELAAAVTAQRGLRHVGEALGSSWGTLLKPLAWNGDLCHGPSRGTRVTFMRPEHASERWRSVPGPDEAAPLAIAAYFRAYGPTTVEAFGNWLAGGYFGKRQLRTWFDALEDRLAEVDVDGERAFVLAEDLDGLASSTPSAVVRLLPGFDQYVLGPGTADGRVVPASRRTAVSRQAGWISPVVLVGGVVCGTWELDGDRVLVSWLGEAGQPPRPALRAEVTRLSTILDRGLEPVIAIQR